MKLFGVTSAFAFVSHVAAFEVGISEGDGHRKACSGMWAGAETHITVSFDTASRGQIAMIIYEQRDAGHIGIDTDRKVKTVPRRYTCTTDAVIARLCPQKHLGRFLLDLRSLNVSETSIWSATVGFTSSAKPTDSAVFVGTARSWDNPSENPVSPPSEWDSGSRGLASKVGRRTMLPDLMSMGINNTVVPSGVLWYSEPILYRVERQGYYCVDTIPLTIGATAENALGANFTGNVLFHNTFMEGLKRLNITKLTQFYMVLALACIILGGAWGFLCFKHRGHLVPLQHHISYLLGLLAVEMSATWAYYLYLNSHDRGIVATLFLVALAILGVGRYSLSLFLLLVTAARLKVEPEDPDAMTPAKYLAGGQFVSGGLFTLMVVLSAPESTAALILLAIALFLSLLILVPSFLWLTMSVYRALTDTVRSKQAGKLGSLSRILLVALAEIVLGVFAVISIKSIPDPSNADHGAELWETSWYLLDTWLKSLYLIVFTGIISLWLPKRHNECPAMSGQPTQGAGAENYDLEAMASRSSIGASGFYLPQGGHGWEPLRQGDAAFEAGSKDEGGDWEGLKTQDEKEWLMSANNHEGRTREGY